MIMNVKRLVLSCIAVFIFIFGFSWIFHGMLLKPIYVSTASLWRTDVEMEHYFGWLMLGQFVMAIGFCAIYAQFALMATGACSVCSRVVMPSRTLSSAVMRKVFMPWLTAILPISMALPRAMMTLRISSVMVIASMMAVRPA